MGFESPFGTRNLKILNKTADFRGLGTTKVQLISFATIAPVRPSHCHFARRAEYSVSVFANVRTSIGARSLLTAKTVCAVTPSP